jgi:hypothetical protein
MDTDLDPLSPSGTDVDDQEGANGQGMDDTGALLGQLKTIHDEIKQKDYHRDTEIPGYQKMLWARFKPYPVAKGGRRAKVMRKRFEDDDPAIVLDSACDTLIDACEQIMLLPPKFGGDIGEDGENLKPIDDESFIAFDSRLADLFNIEVPSHGSKARAVVKGLFPTEQGIVGMAMELSEWLRDVTKESGEEFLGE